MEQIKAFPPNGGVAVDGVDGVMVIGSWGDGLIGVNGISYADNKTYVHLNRAQSLRLAEVILTQSGPWKSEEIYEAVKTFQKGLAGKEDSSGP